MIRQTGISGRGARETEEKRDLLRKYEMGWGVNEGRHGKTVPDGRRGICAAEVRAGGRGLAGHCWGAAWSLVYCVSTQRENPPAGQCKHPADSGTVWCPALLESRP